MKSQSGKSGRNQQSRRRPKVLGNSIAKNNQVTKQTRTKGATKVGVIQSRRSGFENLFRQGDDVPLTSFQCSDQQFPGLYADPEAQCRVSCTTPSTPLLFLCNELKDSLKAQPNICHLIRSSTCAIAMGDGAHSSAPPELPLTR